MSAAGFTPLSAPPAPYGAHDVEPQVPGARFRAPRENLRDPVDPQTFVNAYTRPLPSLERTFAGPGYESRPAPTSGFAVAALVCGIVGVFTLIPALGAIVLGHLGLWQTSKRTHAGHGLAIGGMVLGYAVAAVVALVMLATWIAGL